jgi:hypothetical protein
MKTAFFSPSRQRVTLILVLTVWLIAACNGASQVTNTPASQSAVTGSSPRPSPSGAVQPNPKITSSPPITSQKVLDACQVASQAQAMRAGQVPDWDSLGLSICYQLNLSLDLEESAYHGSAKIIYTNHTGVELPDLVLRTYPNSTRIYGGELSISSPLVNGQPVETETFLPDNTAVRLNLVNPLKPGDSLEIDLDFQGRYPQDFGNSTGIYGIFNYVSAEQVLTLANGYPLLAPWRDGGWDVQPVIGIGDAVVSAGALYLVDIQAPENWQVVTSGTALESGDNVSGSAHWRFASGLMRDFVIIASPNFTLREEQVDGVLIHHWGLPEGRARWDDAVQATVDALSLFNQRFGPYPYNELDAVSVPLELASGVEYPGVFIIGARQYQPNNQRPFLLGIVVAHEVAHQWWYGVVGNDVIEHPWQDEALATFSSLLYQQVYQPDVYAGTLQFYRDQVSALDQGSGDTAIDQPLQAFIDRSGQYSPVVYTKGALFFVDLRDRLGDQVFFNGLDSYYEDEKYKIASPADLLGAFETACGCNLDDFYTQWGAE